MRVWATALSLCMHQRERGAVNKERVQSSSLFPRFYQNMETKACNIYLFF